MAHDWADIISTSEAAEILKCTRDHVARLCRQRDLDSGRLLMPNKSIVWLVSRRSCMRFREGWWQAYKHKQDKTPPVPWRAKRD